MALPSTNNVLSNIDLTITCPICGFLYGGSSNTKEEFFPFKIVFDKILDTNEKVDITYTNFEGEEISDTSDVTPKLRLTEPPKVLPKAGTPILVALFVAGAGIAVFSYVKFKNMER